MSCSIQKETITWEIPHTEKLYRLLALKKEIAGKFVIDTVKKKSTANITIIEGSESSVSAPKALINYHTHPAICYLTEKTVFGMPSGEDMRETILFGLKGSIAHLVIAIEGTYLCQVNSNILVKLINLNIPRKSISAKLNKFINTILQPGETIDDLYRGFIIQCIEIYFRSTHVFRTTEFIDKFAHVNPIDYINFCNNFTFRNIFYDTDNSCTNIKCNEVWAYENKKLVKKSFSRYIHEYEYDEQLYIANKHGTVRLSDVDVTKFVKHGGLEPIKQYFSLEQWFNVGFFPHKIKFKNVNNIDFYVDLPHKIKQNVIKDIANGFQHCSIVKYKDPVFTYYDMVGLCEHTNIKKKLMDDSMNKLGSDIKVHKLGTLLLVGSDKCDFCSKLYSNLKKKKAKVNYAKYPDIEQAINIANKLRIDSGSQPVHKIPALFHFQNKKIKLLNHTMLQF